jgi:hypothetical protein
MSADIVKSEIGSMLAVFAYDPLVRGLLTEDHHAISIIDPILSCHHWLHSLKFLASCITAARC